MAGNETSKFIALILRHKPEEIGISLDEHGWANVDELIAGIEKRSRLRWKCSKKSSLPMKNNGTPLMKTKP